MSGHRDQVALNVSVNVDVSPTSWYQPRATCGCAWPVGATVSQARSLLILILTYWKILSIFCINIHVGRQGLCQRLVRARISSLNALNTSFSIRSVRYVPLSDWEVPHRTDIRTPLKSRPVLV